MHNTDECVIEEELRYNNTKEDSISGTMIQIIMRTFYIIGRSSDPYTQQQNKCEGQMVELK